MSNQPGKDKPETGNVLKYFDITENNRIHIAVTKIGDGFLVYDEEMKKEFPRNKIDEVEDIVNKAMKDVKLWLSETLQTKSNYGRVDLIIMIEEDIAESKLDSIQIEPIEQDLTTMPVLIQEYIEDLNPTAAAQIRKLMGIDPREDLSYFINPESLSRFLKKKGMINTKAVLKQRNDKGNRDQRRDDRGNPPNHQDTRNKLQDDKTDNVKFRIGPANQGGKSEDEPLKEKTIIFKEDPPNK